MANKKTPIVIGEIIPLHEKLAERFKQFENVDGDYPPTVVLNEMRYSLRAAVKVIDQASFDHVTDTEELSTLNESLQEMNHALKNAYHDLVDGLVIQLTRLLDDLAEQYPQATTNILGSKQLEMVHDINKVEECIVKSRRETKNRKQVYETLIYEQHFTKLLSHYELLKKTSVPRILVEAKKIKTESLANTRKYNITLAISILGIALAILSILLAL